MFCDLVGSTAISAQLDAEEWRDLVGAYLDAASAAVTEFGGHVAKKKWVTVRHSHRGTT
jgi:class 3 adenylate cyclase